MHCAQEVGDGGKGKSVQEDSVLAETSQVPSVEKVMQVSVPVCLCLCLCLVYVSVLPRASR